MLAKIVSAATIGLTAVPIEVEVDIASQGLPAFNIVGLPNKAVEESKERVRSAIKNSGAEFPARRITVNLAPADIPKEGVAFDLPIAVGVLTASKQIGDSFSSDLFIGELSLDGSLRYTKGILPIAFLAKEKGFARLFVPQSNGWEATLVDGIEVYPVRNLAQLINHLIGKEKIVRQKKVLLEKKLGRGETEFDFSEIQGQEHAKRALEIAAAGFHNVLMKGFPGVGKTMLARAFPSILPSLTEEEALEVTQIFSITGNLKHNQYIVRHRPFRAPHHTISKVGLIGGGTHLRPGEVSMAHRGALFLDELPEFSRDVLEALRQPLEEGVVTISRALGTITYPAKFLLIAALNPCPCGYYGSSIKPCKCLPSQIVKYQRRISGPLLDRIDIHLEIPEVSFGDLTKTTSGETSSVIRQRVDKARLRQARRFKGLQISTNGEMTTKHVKEFCPLTSECQSLLGKAVRNLGLSARSYYKVIKVARTIADLEDSEEILVSHVAEALQYRPKDTSQYQF